jgi:carbonic anhydrase
MKMKIFNRVTAGLAISLSLGAITLLSLSVVKGQDATATPAPAPHWEYEGEEGPEHWGDLDASFAACSTGHAQSPIDISSDSLQTVSLQDIKFDYHSSAVNIFNNGHTVQVNYDEGSSITYNEIKYNLLQFHFHHPSEHTIDGEDFDMELHFVHRDDKGNLAVVGVLLNAGDEENTSFTELLDNLPPEKSDVQTLDFTVDAAAMLPEAHLFDTYVGSLTTPPCSEGVRWLVLTTPVDLSAEQIERFASIFELDARPVQPLNDRDLLGDSSEG